MACSELLQSSFGVAYSITLQFQMRVLNPCVFHSPTRTPSEEISSVLLPCSPKFRGFGYYIYHQSESTILWVILYTILFPWVSHMPKWKQMKSPSCISTSFRNPIICRWNKGTNIKKFQYKLFFLYQAMNLYFKKFLIWVHYSSYILLLNYPPPNLVA